MTVFSDDNGDGVRDATERSIPGITVVHGRDRARTGPGAPAALPVSPGDLVWARVPAGFRPGPAWATVHAGRDVEIAIRPLDDVTLSSTFVVAADSHVPIPKPGDPWDGGDLAAALAQATALPSPPQFVTIVGDMTQGGTLEELDRVRRTVERLGIPWVPVAGNHDTYDFGVAYARVFGPASYSFDLPDAHVVVWDTNAPEADQRAFFVAELADIPRATTVIALGHASPSDALADELAALGVDAMFTGHWHANRRVERTGLAEWGTQPLLMGGIDGSPAGYRVVHVDAGLVTVEGRDLVLAPQLAIASPAACAGVDIVVAAARDARVPSATARIDCGAPIALTPAGGWDLVAPLPPLEAGRHTLEVARGTQRVSRAFDACASPAGWVAAVGASPALGAPIVAGDLVVVATVDRGAGDRAGLAALDLATGTPRWNVATPYPVVASPAVADDTVIASLANGELRAYDLRTGAPRFTYDVAAGIPTLAASLWAAPTIADGVVYAGVQERFAAIDLRSGAARWTVERTSPYPWLGSLASVAVVGDLAIGTFARDGGLVARDRASGALRWSAAIDVVEATPVGDGETIYVATAAAEVIALDARTGTRRWTQRVHSDANDWSYAITAAPALANGTLYVATRWGALVALDAASGRERWRAHASPGPLVMTHYRSGGSSFVASPVVIGDRVWLGGLDGHLVAYDADTGAPKSSVSLGVPITTAVARTDDALIVATFDGTVHRLEPDAPVASDDVPPCPPLDTGCAGTTSSLAPLAFANRKRKRRRTRDAVRESEQSVD